MRHELRAARSGHFPSLLVKLLLPLLLILLVLIRLLVPRTPNNSDKKCSIVLDAVPINQSITGFRYGALYSLPVTEMIQRRRVAMINRRRIEKDVPSVSEKIEIVMMFL